MQKFILAPEIHYGEDSLMTLRDLKSKRVFIVTDSSMLKFKIAQMITDILDESNIEWLIYQDVEPNPSVETVSSILKEYMKFEADCIIALGGGSPIDAAKGAIYFADRLQKSLGAISNEKKPYFVAIPTTSGTGSEVTSYSVLTDLVGQTKIALSDPCMLANLAVLDPVFTKTLPKTVIADTGMDVLTHATEAFVSNKRNSYTNALALESIKEVFAHLIANYKNPADEIHRTAMQNASCMAGIAFNNSSLGINHSLAHSIGGRFHISHGKINAILLPYVARFNSGINPKNNLDDFGARAEYALISKQIGLPCENDLQGAMSYILALEILKDELKIHKNLKEYGIEEKLYLEAVDTLAEQAMNDICTVDNPIKVSLDDLKRILLEVYYGK